MRIKQKPRSNKNKSNRKLIESKALKPIQLKIV